MSEPERSNEQIANSALANPEVPKIYTNGFVLGLSAADAFVVLQSGPSVVAVIQMSYPIVKTLAVQLTTLLTDYEAKTGQKVGTVGEITDKLAGH